MESSGDHFLARAALARDKHGSGRSRRAFDLVHQAAHTFAADNGGHSEKAVCGGPVKTWEEAASAGIE
jgi:hypothetical protein